MISELPTRLDCTDCKRFTEYVKRKDTVVECVECGKVHKAPDSLYVVNEEMMPYNRDESGSLQELPP